MKKRIKSKAGSVADVRHDFNEQASQSVAEFMYLPCMWDLMDKYPEDFPVGKFVKMVPALGGLSSGGLSSGGVKCWVSEIEYARKEHVAECVPTFLDVLEEIHRIRVEEELYQIEDEGGVGFIVSSKHTGESVSGYLGSLMIDPQYTVIIAASRRVKEGIEFLLSGTRFGSIVHRSAVVIGEGNFKYPGRAYVVDYSRLVYHVFPSKPVFTYTRGCLRLSYFGGWSRESILPSGLPAPVISFGDFSDVF